MGRNGRKGNSGVDIGNGRACKTGDRREERAQVSFGEDRSGGGMSGVRGFFYRIPPITCQIARVY